MGDDAQLRSAAFHRVRELEDRFRGAIPAAAIEAGFLLHGESIHLSGRARGIFHPRQMRRGVLSVETTIPREGRQRRYDDIASDDGFFDYKFTGTDPQSNDNLRLCDKSEGETCHVERWNNTLRQRLGRFVRKTLSFSKCDRMQELALRLFIHQYNQQPIL